MDFCPLGHSKTFKHADRYTAPTMSAAYKVIMDFSLGHFGEVEQTHIDILSDIVVMANSIVYINECSFKTIFSI